MDASRSSQRLGSAHSWAATQVRPVSMSSRPGNRSSQEGFETGWGRTSPSTSRRAHSTGTGSSWSVGKCSQGPRPPRPCSSKSARSFEKSTIPGQSSSHRVARQSRRGVFGQETEADAVDAAIEGRDRLEAEVAEGERSFQEEKLRLQEHPGSVPMDISPSRQSNLMVELEQLQMRVAQLQAQNEELMSSPKRQAVGSGAAPDRGSRLREDFVPACDEDVVRWIRDRQLDMQDATTVGNAQELHWMWWERHWSTDNVGISTAN